jgi:hypothetical protein
MRRESVQGTYNPNEATDLDGDNPLKVSKSSFMTVNKCPRQYWWRKIGLADVEIPANPAMMRGSRIHDAYEYLFSTWKFDVRFPNEPPYTQDISDALSASYAGCDPHEDDVVALIALAELENARIDEWGLDGYAPLMFEKKLTYDCPELGVRLVGIPDAVLVRPNGDLVIVELKTGNWNDGKMGRTRRELCFYWHILNKLGYGQNEPDIYFMYVVPDCDNYDLLTKLESVKSKTVWSGDAQGVTIIEKMNARSYNTMLKWLGEAVTTLKEGDWDMKWDDYYCTSWCDFYMSCDSEIQGDSEPPWIEVQNVVVEEEGWDS